MKKSNKFILIMDLMIKHRYTRKRSHEHIYANLTWLRNCHSFYYCVGSSRHLAFRFARSSSFSSWKSNRICYNYSCWFN